MDETPPLLFTEPINGADNIADVSRITISQEGWNLLKYRLNDSQTTPPTFSTVSVPFN